MWGSVDWSSAISSMSKKQAGDVDGLELGAGVALLGRHVPAGVDDAQVGRAQMRGGQLVLTRCSGSPLAMLVLASAGPRHSDERGEGQGLGGAHGRRARATTVTC